MADSCIAFVGLGLIGGSIAKGIKRKKPNAKIMAYMRSRSKLQKAKEDGVVDVILDGIDDRLSECSLLFLCMPVEYNARYLAKVKPFLKPGTIVTDVGSTKADIHEAAVKAEMEDCFIGGHPMAGSEKTGYENSTGHLLENAYYIITPTRASAKDAVGRLTFLASLIGAIPIVLDYREHDFATAAISHLPHIIASSLVNLVQNCDSEAGLMKQLAAGGFKDITRIASSSPEMWEQICVSNREPLADVLEQYIDSLSETLRKLRSGDGPYLSELFQTSRDYRNSISERGKGTLAPEYSFTVDVADEVGAISTLSAILAANGISIRNIGINHNRERGEGALKIHFYNKASLDMAWAQLERRHYNLISNK